MLASQQFFLPDNNQSKRSVCAAAGRQHRTGSGFTLPPGGRPEPTPGLPDRRAVSQNPLGFCLAAGRQSRTGASSERPPGGRVNPT